jgi:hypothetical protein
VDPGGVRSLFLLIRTEGLSPVKGRVPVKSWSSVVYNENILDVWKFMLYFGKIIQKGFQVVK